MAQIRSSKFRHLFGTPFQLRDCYGDLLLGQISTESKVIKANDQFFAIPWRTPGSLCVVPLSRVGTVPEETPLFINNSEDGKVQINEFEFCPHNNDVIAAAGQDGAVATFKIPGPEGLTKNLDPELRFQASEKRLLYVDWHPLASGLVITSSADKDVSLWDVEAGGSEITKLPNVHKGLLTNTSWNLDGSLLSTCSKDKFVRIFDPRGNQLIGEILCHDSPKSSRVQWMGQKNVIVTAGFTKTSERELAIFDPRNLSSRVQTVKLSASSSSMILFADEDSNLLFVAGKGDSTISYFDITNDPVGAHSLSEYKSNTPQNGLALLPKSVCNVKNCEIVRFLKLSGSRAEPIRFEVTRQQSSFFQDDLYPDTWDRKSSVNASSWASGNNGSRDFVSLRPADM